MLPIFKQLRSLMDIIPIQTLQPFLEKYLDERKGKTSALIAPEIIARCH